MKFQRNFYLMMPWVVLGGMLIIGLLVSVIVTAVNFYTDGSENGTFNGTLWLVLGLIAFGNKYKVVVVVVRSNRYNITQSGSQIAYYS